MNPDFNIIHRFYDYFGKTLKRGPWKAHSNQASKLGHPCERYLTYRRSKHWDKATPMTIETAMLMKEGRNQEKQVRLDLIESGMNFIKKDVLIEEPRYDIRGKLDGIIEENNEESPAEIKSLDGNTWKQICFDGARCYEWEEVEKVFLRKKYLKQYFGQLQIYLYGCAERDEYPYGLFILKDRSFGGLSQITVQFDEDYTDTLLEKALRINEYLASGFLPQKEYLDGICERCEFYHVCLPDRFGENWQQLIDKHVSKWLQEREECQEFKRNFDKTDRKIKTWFKKLEQKKLMVNKEWLLYTAPHGDGEKIVIERLPKLEEE